MTTIEAMRKALEALERLENCVHNIGGEHVTDLRPAIDAAEASAEIITALRAELERMEDVLEPSKSRKHGLAPHMTREAQQASSWRMVCATLDEVLPDWLDIESGLDITQSKAVCAIHHLASRRPPIAPAIPALTEAELVNGHLAANGLPWDFARWAYALAAERAGARIKE